MDLYQKIQNLCHEKGFTISNLSSNIQNLSVSKGAISMWKNGAVPRSETIKKIADYFGVPVEYFYDNETKVPTGETLTDDEKQLLSIFRDLPLRKRAELVLKAYELQEK